MKKCVIFLITAVLLLGLPIFPAEAAYYSVNGDNVTNVFLQCLDNGMIVCEKNADEKAAPASITKIVTAILTIENCADLEQIISAPSYCIRLLDGTGSSTAGILVGEEISVRELLYCLLVYSGNDAANILADFIGGGSIDTFITMMNEFVQRLGCKNTHFVNAHGLDDPNHYTTARDLAVIYSYCIQNGVFAEIAGTYQYDMPATNKYKEVRYLRNTNGLLNPGISDYYYEYAKNGKTGTTNDAGRCVISSASKDGYNYICVVLGGKMIDFDNDGVEENMAFVTSKELYDWAFKNLRIREIANGNTYVAEARVIAGKDYDYVGLAPANTVTALVPKDITVQSVLIKPYTELTKDTVTAPVKKGDILGKAAIKYADEVIAEVDLAAAFDVQRSTPKYVVYLIKNLLKTTVFKLILLAVIAIGVPVCILFFVVIPRKRRSGKQTVHVVNVGEMEKKRKKRKTNRK